MRRLACIISFVLAASLVARADCARAAPLRVLGARSITDERGAAVLRANGFPDERSVRALQELYFANGHLFATVSVRVEADSSRTVVIDEGDPARVRRVLVSGASTRPPAEIRRRLRLEAGAAFVPRELARGITELLSDYDRAGFPFAQVWVDSIGVDADSFAVDLALTVVEGTTRTISAVVVEGLEKTRTPLVVKIAGIERGEEYRAQLLEDAFLRLTSSGVFTEVEYPTVRLSADGQGVDAVIRVEEPERAHSFAGAMGYASAEGDQKRTLSGLLQLDLNNIGGSLKDLGVRWSNDGTGRNETHIRYRDRLFLGRRLEAGVRLEQVGQDTLYTWQSAGVEFARNFGRALGTLVGASVGAYGDRNVFSSGDLVRSARWRARVGASALNGSERRGGYGKLEAAVTFALKDNTYRAGASGPADVHQTIYDGAVEGVVPVWRSLTYALEGRIDWLESSEAVLPLPEQFYLGGARTVRGYRENQFHGRRAAYARNELRWGRTPREGLYLFIDAGAVRQETLTATGAAAYDRVGLAGGGFGVRSTSRVGRIDLSFALSEELSLQQTKVHVVLEQSF